MANVTIPDLPPTISIAGNEPMECVQSGVSKQVTTGQIALLALSLIKGGTSTGIICSNRQMRSALSAGGNLVTVDNAAPADINNAITIEWRNGNLIVYQDSVSNFIQSTLSYSSAQMLALFAQALTYPV